MLTPPKRTQRDIRSAGQRVSDINILLIPILLNLPPKDLLFIGRVCHRWNYLLGITRTIRHTLFFEKTQKPRHYVQGEETITLISTIITLHSQVRVYKTRKTYSRTTTPTSTLAVTYNPQLLARGQQIVNCISQHV